MRKNKPLQLDLLLTAILVFLITSLFLVNAIALILSNRYPLQLDLTANLAYGIGDETKEFLADVDQPVTINVMALEERFSESSYLAQMLRILQQYPLYSNQITLKFVNYLADPTFAAAYSNLTLGEGDVLVTGKNDVRHIKLENMFNYATNAAGQQYIQSSRVEEAVTSAIFNLLTGDSIQAAFLTGSSNAEVPSFAAVLTNNNIDISNANITTDSLEVFDLLMLISPQSDLSGDAIRKLEEYLFNNGEYGKTLLYTANVDQPPLPNLEAFLSEWGVKMGDGAVFETVGYRTYQMQPYLPIALYEDGKYTDSLKDETIPFMMPLAKPFEVLFSAKDNQIVTQLLTFSSTAGVRPSDADESFTIDDSGQKGPIPALVLATRKESTGNRTSNLVISGSTAMLDTAAIENTGLNNAEYMINLINDLADREQSIVIQPKSLGGRALAITSSQVTKLGIILCGVLPLSILVIGLVIWLRRRFK